MVNDLLERLADVDVPPPPAEFDRQLHERVNRTLLVVQLIDFAMFAVPRAMVYFGRAVLGLIAYTVTGDFPLERRARRRNTR